MMGLMVDGGLVCLEQGAAHKLRVHRFDIVDVAIHVEGLSVLSHSVRSR